MLFRSIDDAVTARSAANKAEASRIYRETMGSPEAQYVQIPDELSGNTAIRNAQKDVETNLRDLKTKYGYDDIDIIPPTAGSAPIKDPFTGQVRQEAVPPTNGNLAYWDMVKKRLWDMSQEAGSQTLEGISANNARKSLTTHLDNEVPGYQNARDAHIESIGQLDASNVGREIGRAHV